MLSDTLLVRGLHQLIAPVDAKHRHTAGDGNHAIVFIYAAFFFAIDDITRTCGFRQRRQFTDINQAVEWAANNASVVGFFIAGANRICSAVWL
ncbi:hypothetical protein [Erwinia psidii]|uniref:hypothetical protein n=1 Tax=Erwinia psidii TaxID=69224 RepID=UPI00226B6712|nr:hypothetical protein [Erwinia psidii]